MRLLWGPERHGVVVVHRSGRLALAGVFMSFSEFSFEVPVKKHDATLSKGKHRFTIVCPHADI